MGDHQRNERDADEHVHIEERVVQRPVEGNDADRPRETESQHHEKRERRERADRQCQIDAGARAATDRAPRDAVLPRECQHQRDAGDPVQHDERIRDRWGGDPRQQARRDEARNDDEEREVHHPPRHHRKS